MNKYEELYKNVYSVFASDNWKAEDIKTVPSNFSGDTAGTYIRVSIIPSGYQEVNFLKSVSGQVMIDIFTPIGYGPKLSYEIADILDNYLAGKEFRITGTTQFLSSSLSLVGVDSDNSNLYRMIYSIPFNHFGVS